MEYMKRKPWLAGLLSLICPGLGQIYCGQMIAGVLLFFIFPFWKLSYAILTNLDFLPHKFSLLIIFMCFVPFIGLSICVHAILLAKKTKDSSLKKYQNVYVYIVLFIFLSGAYKITGKLSEIYFAEAFRIPAGAMEPTLKIGDNIIVNKIYHLMDRNPKRGEMVVFRYPINPSTIYIKRIEGIPGDTLEIRKGTVLINGQPVSKVIQTDRYILDDIEDADSMNLYKEITGDVSHYTLYYSPNLKEQEDFAPITIPPNNFFVMGDNRDKSSDSRVWRFVPRENILGKPLFIWWSTDKNQAGWRGFPFVRWNRIGKTL